MLLADLKRSLYIVLCSASKELIGKEQGEDISLSHYGNH